MPTRLSSWRQSSGEQSWQFVSDLRQSIIDSQAADEPLILSGNIEFPVDLSGVSIGHLDARHVTFAAPVNFCGAHFRGISWFDGARFAATADFSEATFDLDARFDAAIFDRDALFINSEFNGVAAFDRVTFNGGCAFDRSTCFGNLSVGEAVFADFCSFRSATCLGGLWCFNATFGSLDITQLEVQGRSFLRGATIKQHQRSQNLTTMLRGNWYPFGDIRF